MTQYQTAAKVTLTPGSANVKGNYSQLIASTSFEATGIIISLGIVAGSQSDALIDIAVGAAAAESVKIPNILFPSGPVASRFAHSMFLPISIPAGSRVAARIQSSGGAAATVDIVATMVRETSPNPRSVDTVVAYGPDTSDSGGLLVDPGASAGTKGAYTQFSDSLAQDCKWMVVVFSGRRNSAMTTANWLFDIATGAGGSEVVLVGDILLTVNSSGNIPFPAVYAFPCDLPAGTRVAIRAQSSTNDATDRLIDVAIYTSNTGVPVTDDEVSGTVELNSNPIEGASVLAINSTTLEVFGPVETDVNGDYTLPVVSGALYHIIVEYEDGGQKYRSLSHWGVTPV